ncbi:hypothetical protein, partial [Streptomyces sp. NPDC059003]|uniref:hypothetical protein n=1 Tax=Streptomyces sp. NPDC059003 TaxID=3346691 RepID=UPI0036CB95EE
SRNARGTAPKRKEWDDMGVGPDDLAGELDVDFERAEATRVSMAEGLPPEIDADIAKALKHPDTPDVLLSRPFQVVDAWDALNGPEEPRAAVLARGLPGAARSAAGTGASLSGDLCRTYADILLAGSTASQAALLNPQLLIELWPELVDILPVAVTSVWEQRFTQLRRQP